MLVSTCSEQDTIWPSCVDRRALWWATWSNPVSPTRTPTVSRWVREWVTHERVNNLPTMDSHSQFLDFFLPTSLKNSHTPSIYQFQSDLLASVSQRRLRNVHLTWYGTVQSGALEPRTTCTNKTNISIIISFYRQKVYPQRTFRLLQDSRGTQQRHEKVSDALNIREWNMLNFLSVNKMCFVCTCSPRLKCTWLDCSVSCQMNITQSSLTHWSQQIALELINWGCVWSFEWCGQKKIQKLWMTIHCWQIIHSLMRYSLSHSPTHCRSSCRTYWVASGRSSQSPPIHTAGSYCILLRTGTH